MLFIWTLKFCWLILWNECSQVFEMNTIPFHENVHTKLNYFSFFWSYGFWHFQSILHSSGYQFIRSFGFGLQDELAMCCIFEVLEQTQWTIINWWSIQKTNYYFFVFILIKTATDQINFYFLDCGTYEKYWNFLNNLFLSIFWMLQWNRYCFRLIILKEMGKKLRDCIKRSKWCVPVSIKM